MESKSVFASKTLWFNLITGAIEIAQMVGDLGIAPPGTMTLAVNIGNIILRLLTNQPVTLLRTDGTILKAK